jgi:hypothetical protein
MHAMNPPTTTRPPTKSVRIAISTSSKLTITTLLNQIPTRRISQSIDPLAQSDARLRDHVINDGHRAIEVIIAKTGHLEGEVFENKVTDVCVRLTRPLEGTFLRGVDVEAIALHLQDLRYMGGGEVLSPSLACFFEDGPFGRVSHASVLVRDFRVPDSVQLHRSAVAAALVVEADVDVVASSFNAFGVKRLMGITDEVDEKLESFCALGGIAVTHLGCLRTRSATGSCRKRGVSHHCGDSRDHTARSLTPVAVRIKIDTTLLWWVVGSICRIIVLDHLGKFELGGNKAICTYKVPNICVGEFMSTPDPVCPGGGIADIQTLIILQKVIDEVSSCVSEKCFSNVANRAVA